MYRIPTRLWSTVVKKPSQPGRSSQTSSSSSWVDVVSGGRAVGGSTVVMGSPQGLEIGDEGGHVVGAQAEVGHQGAGLHGLGVGQPVAQLVGCVVEPAGRQGQAAGEVGEIGPGGADGAGARDAVAAGARRRREQLLAPLAIGSG